MLTDELTEVYQGCVEEAAAGVHELVLGLRKGMVVKLQRDYLSLVNHSRHVYNFSEKTRDSLADVQSVLKNLRQSPWCEVKVFYKTLTFVPLRKEYKPLQKCGLYSECEQV